MEGWNLFMEKKFVLDNKEIEDFQKAICEELNIQKNQIEEILNGEISLTKLREKISPLICKEEKKVIEEEINWREIIENQPIITPKNKKIYNKDIMENFTAQKSEDKTIDKTIDKMNLLFIYSSQDKKYTVSDKTQKDIETLFSNKCIEAENNIDMLFSASCEIVYYVIKNPNTEKDIEDNIKNIKNQIYSCLNRKFGEETPKIFKVYEGEDVRVNKNADYTIWSYHNISELYNRMDELEDKWMFNSIFNTELAKFITSKLKCYDSIVDELWFIEIVSMISNVGFALKYAKEYLDLRQQIISNAEIIVDLKFLKEILINSISTVDCKELIVASFIILYYNGLKDEDRQKILKEMEDIIIESISTKAENHKLEKTNKRIRGYHILNNMDYARYAYIQKKIIQHTKFLQNEKG